MSCKLKNCAIHTFTRYKVTFSRKKKARKREFFTKESFHEIVDGLFQTIARFKRYTSCIEIWFKNVFFLIYTS